MPDDELNAVRTLSSFLLAQPFEEGTVAVSTYGCQHGRTERLPHCGCLCIGPGREPQEGVWSHS